MKNWIRTSVEYSALGAILTVLTVTACSPSSSDDDGGGGAGAGPGPGSNDAEWELVELDDTFCGDGSQYKFFVKRGDGAKNLVVTLEPGGGCWNYATCTGENGVLRVANLDGIDDDHMTALPPPLGKVEDGIPWGLMFPHLGGSDKSVATLDYNQVYFPYCTGDAFLGEFVAEYESDSSGDSIQIHHHGAHNLRVAQDWLKNEFTDVDHLLVTGASAGGLGATVNYAFIREALDPKRSSLLNDSGPLFPPGGPQDAARQAFAQRWQSDALLESLDELLGASDDERLVDDSGNINALLARHYDKDRFIAAHFMRDLNYSLFSYEGFFDDLSTEEVYELWEEDTQLLIDQMTDYPNWGYYLPGFRADGCSHVVGMLPIDEFTNSAYVGRALKGSADGYLRTDIGELNFGAALGSAIAESGEPIREQEDEPEAAFTEEEEAACRLWPE